MKKYYLIIGAITILFNFLNRLNAQTFIVTDKFMGNIGSFDVILPQAINNANAGNNVTVLFNAPGLCEVINVLPAISISNGSLVFDKHPLASVPQGFQSSPSIPPSFVATALNINNTALTTSITIKNLTFTNLHDIYSSSISMLNANNISIQACHFDQVCPSIVARNVDNLAITTCSLSYTANSGNNPPGIVYQEWGGITTVRDVTVTSNVFTSANPTQVPFNNAGPAMYYWNMFSNSNLYANLTIKNNSISNYGAGIRLFNNGNNPVVDNTFQADIENNTIIAYDVDIEIQLPYKHLIVNNNNLTMIPDNFSPYAANLVIYNTSGNPAPWGIDFVAANSLGYTTGNGNNIFNSTFSPANTINLATYHSIFVWGEFGLKNNIVGLNTAGRIGVYSGKSTFVRQNKIKSNAAADFPIKLNSSISNPPGNGNIQKPTLTQAYITSVGPNQYLNVNYSTPGLNPSNGDFAVDFYKSNANGDLTDYVGSYTITSLAGSYLSTVLIPVGVTLNSNDRIAVTVSGLGNFAASPIGTSEASFIIIPPCPVIPGFTHITIPGGPCQKFEVNATIAGYNGPPCPTSSLTANWNFGDATGTFTSCADGGGAAFAHLYTVPGTYTVTLTVTGPGSCIATASQVITATCGTIPCSDCIGSFAPIAGKKYILSAWTKENNAPQSTTSYVKPSITVQYTPAATPSVFIPSGLIIDGWQRVEGEFFIPAGTTNIGLTLDCSSGDCFFDDIRVFPFDGSMKSYVYDPVNMRLVAELDERNYATLYDYDEDGKLIRVKKETERGKMTIQENRNNTKKP
jgi:hypothetical protein